MSTTSATHHSPTPGTRPQPTDQTTMDPAATAPSAGSGTEAPAVPVEADTSRGGSLRPRLPFWACVVIAPVAMLANYIGLVPVQVVARTLFPHADLADSPLLNIAQCLAVLATAMLVTWALTRWVLRARLRDIGWHLTRDSWWIFLLGWALTTIPLLVGAAVEHVPGWSVPFDGLDRSEVSTSYFVLAGIAKICQALPMQGIPEELQWRGWLMNCLAHRPRTALAVATVVFGLMHCFSNGGMHGWALIAYPLQAAGFAFLAGALALRMRSLWAAIGVHGGMHLSILALGLLGVSTDGVPIWVTMAATYAVIALAVLRGWHGDRVVYER